MFIIRYSCLFAGKLDTIEALDISVTDIEFMQIMKEQFPEKDGYMFNTSSRLTFTDFPARIQFFPEDNDSCTIVMDPADSEVGV